jgi:hypothetical protein
LAQLGKVAKNDFIEPNAMFSQAVNPSTEVVANALKCPG